ncbi:MAG: serine hydrolase domain-containing protein [Bdellovibrionota bacterium]
MFWALLGWGVALAQPFYEHNPTYRDPVNDDATWCFASPASMGLRPAPLEEAASLFGEEPYSFSLLVVRHDKLVFERYFHGADSRASNNVHSASKSILSAAVGIAVARGVLKGTSLRTYLPETPRGVTLRQLLSMTSGISWQEDKTELQIEKEPDWVAAILARGFSGHRFNYSTGNTHLLSAALGAASGVSLETFTRRNLFTPLGIDSEHWGADPQGVSSGGFNVYLTARELAKFGRLYLREGKWNGKQLVPRAWVRASLRKHTHAHDGYDYGYGWWLRKIRGVPVKMAWGYGGQMLFLVPSLDMAVVMTTNTAKFSPEFDGVELMRRYLLPAAKE